MFGLDGVSLFCLGLIVLLSVFVLVLLAGGDVGVVILMWPEGRPLLLTLRSLLRLNNLL